jgi:UDP-3-O-[3-hydroxymyristoyl] glucosamine N-acyltransferase
MKRNEVTAGELARLFGGALHGNNSLVIRGYKSVEHGEVGFASFITKAREKESGMGCESSLLVLPNNFHNIETLLVERKNKAQATLVHEDPKFFFTRCLQFLEEIDQKYSDVIHQSAVIHSSVSMGVHVSVGPNVVLEQDVVIGSETRIEAGCFIGKGSVVGKNCVVLPGVIINSGVKICNNVYIKSGAVVGCEGFGFCLDKEGKWIRIPQKGGVLVKNNVEIGSNTTIDGGTLDPTIISDGVKIDNLVHIAHNVSVGPNTIIAGCVGVAGSAKIGANCLIGGAAGVLEHVVIPDNTSIGPMSLIMSSLKKPGKYVGVFPVQEELKWKKTAVKLRRLVKDG